MKTALLLHEDAASLAFVRYVLEQHGYLVLPAESVSRARVALTRLGTPVVPDVIVSSPALAAGIAAVRDGIYVVNRVQVPILVLGDAGIALPPDCHVLPDPEPAQLLVSVQALMGAARQKAAAPAGDHLVRVAGLVIDTAAHRVAAGNEPLALTELAFRLLTFLATHPGRVFTRAQLIDYVWGTGVCIEERAVDVQVYRLRNELARVGHGHLVEALRGAGYRFVATPAPLEASLVHKGELHPPASGRH